MSNQGWKQNGSKKIYTTKKVGIRVKSPHAELEVGGTIKADEIKADYAQIDFLNVKKIIGGNSCNFPQGSNYADYL